MLIPEILANVRPSNPAVPNRLRQLAALSMSLGVLAATQGCVNVDLNGDGNNPVADGTFVSPTCKSTKAPTTHTNEGIWTPVVLNSVILGEEQFTCADGSPYVFFVQFNTGATNLTVTLEPGGACWDYMTCKGDAGALNTVRNGGIPNDLMTNINNKPWAALYPHLGRIDNGVATNKYNHVFFPYCTGDAFTGGARSDESKGKQKYTSKDGTASLDWRHHGHRNLEGAAQWLTEQFGAEKTGQLLVAGSSAGAVGAVSNYPLIRDAVAPVCGAMISDAGPVFPPKGGTQVGLYPPYTASAQQGLLDVVSNAWSLKSKGAIVEQLDTRFGNNWYRLVKDYLGHVNRGVARAYPKDRFLFTTFKQDLNFSVFSFLANGPLVPGKTSAEQVLKLWKDEVEDFRKWIVTDDKNWGYYLPNFREDNCSHMVATVPLSEAFDNAYVMTGLDGRANGYYRAEIGSTGFGDALRTLLDPSKPIPRIEQAEDPKQLSFSSVPGVGVANDTWYDLITQTVVGDKQAFINSEKIRCLNTGGYTGAK